MNEFLWVIAPRVNAAAPSRRWVWSVGESPATGMFSDASRSGDILGWREAP